MTLLSFAVAHNLGIYVAAKLDGDPYLANNKFGRPLLHFAVYTPGFGSQPEMVRLLISKGADISKKFKEREDWPKVTAVQVLGWVNKCNQEGQQQKRILEILLEGSGDANSKIWDERRGWRPLIHYISLLAIESRYKLQVWKLLHRYGADMNSTDSEGRTLLEVVAEGPSRQNISFEAALGSWRLVRRFRRGWDQGLRRNETIIVAEEVYLMM
jgi:ankyrin repeat protein